MYGIMYGKDGCWELKSDQDGIESAEVDGQYVPVKVLKSDQDGIERRLHH